MTGLSLPLQVIPKLPENIARLAELSRNFWFSWHRPTCRLFNMLDQELWWKVGRNPRVFLRCVDQSILDMAATSETFLGAYRQVLAEFDAYHEAATAGQKIGNLGNEDLIAYFCAEYGYHESFPVYSGGLGILAGDHCKTASDLRLPFVAVGLMYRQGYFIQRIDREGKQIAENPYLHAEDTPVYPLLGEAGDEVRISCQFPGRDVRARVWQADVGRIRVLLLDTDVPENDDTDREITRTLYSGDNERRLQQEIILGIGGVRALRAANLHPTVWHINEGHAAFLILERARELALGGITTNAALEAVAAGTVFTTHTPVKAGHDVFPRELALQYFAELIRTLQIPEDAFMRLGGEDSNLDMTRLAISGSRYVNGVSRIHSKVSAEICASAWPDIPPDESPIGYVTNGVHVPTFMQQEWTDLLEEFLGPSWRYQLVDQSLMESITEIPASRFWNVNQRVKSRMISALHERLRRQYSRNQLSEAHADRMLKNLDPDNPNALTIGFARRFATYKRANLLFSDLDWLRQIVDTDQRPVVFIFAGKAHPADEPGQALLAETHRVSNLPEFVGKILLVEGYDMGLARLLTSGVDVWLNTPTYSLEASGTSGMKAALNGTVNLSVLDGWWPEAYDGTNGWAIPASTGDQQDEERDRQDAQTLYEVLQDDIIPLYYNRDEKLGYSPDWVTVCQRSMVTVLPHFNSQRVLHDYANCFYGHAAAQAKLLAQNEWAAAKELAEWKERITAAWPGISLSMSGSAVSTLEFTEDLSLAVAVQLGGLQPEDVRVECILRREVCSELTVPVPHYAQSSQIEDGVRYLDNEAVMVQPLEPENHVRGDGTCLYRLTLNAPWCGALNYRIRAVPQHPYQSHPYETGLMSWL